ncbi:nuclear envelope pore membrane protein POM 121-like [Manis javanica]|uniref:nuclear envelope pore membrane protein POM 121-like n=1 Tax=Manis javanica TaxID=9974 RepID=UPI003C6D62D3
MGGVLSKLRPPQPAPDPEARSRRPPPRALPSSEAPPSPQALPRRLPRPAAMAFPFSPHPTRFLGSTGRPHRRVCGTSPHHFGITRPRRYPIQQGGYSHVLPTLCRNGSHRKRVLSRGISRVVCRPSTVRIAPPGSNLAHFPIAVQTHNAPDLWSKEAVLLALDR